MRGRQLRGDDVPTKAPAGAARHLRAVPQGELTEEQLLDDVAAACARFGIKTVGNHERELLRAMLRINRDERRPATSLELSRSIGLTSDHGGRVSAILRTALSRGLYVKPRAGHYVVTQAGEDWLAS